MPAELTDNDSPSISFVAEISMLTLVSIPTLLYIAGNTQYSLVSLFIGLILSVSVIVMLTRVLKNLVQKTAAK